jgi:hypothetical protein
MPTNTYTALATLTLTGVDNSITFGSIPATYRDLVLVSNNITNDAFNQYRLRVNGDTGGNYNDVYMSGTGSAANSGVASNAVEITIYNSGSGTSPATIVTQIMDYAVTDKHKTLLTRASAPAKGVSATASRWANTAAITSITIFTPVGEFTVGSTFSLYGIAS